MAFKLTPEAQARINEYRSWASERKNTVAALDDNNLVATAKIYMAQMTPLNFAPGEPVYDATMWHIILPELLRRIENR
jgi:hypothetical protein